LNHPNIVHIYDIADADGVQFIAMEYVVGKTLDQLIGRRGLRINEALKYAVQIADALANVTTPGAYPRRLDLRPREHILHPSARVGNVSRDTTGGRGSDGRRPHSGDG
jgi:eukaryotic-like serine/threonine-protein kinase